MSAAPGSPLDTDDAERLAAPIVDRLIEAVTTQSRRDMDAMRADLRADRAELRSEIREATVATREHSAALRTLSESFRDLAQVVHAARGPDRWLVLALVAAIISLAGVQVAAQWGDRHVSLSHDSASEQPPHPPVGPEPPPV